MKKLKTYILEVLTDKELEKQLNEFGDLYDQIKELESKLRPLKSKFKKLNLEMLPVIESLKDTTAQTKKYVVFLKKKGFERKDVSYKDAWLNAITKVNQQTRNVLNEALEAAKHTTAVLGKLGISKLESINLQEGPLDFIKKLSKKIKMWFNQIKIIKSENKTLKKLIGKL